jgi:hypothetical protein
MEDSGMGDWLAIPGLKKKQAMSFIAVVGSIF